ncbi:hypothetical protein J2W33_001647 [Variovorax boronicumulans]|nr:hypothetical protein [Variovorax boronicumulans]
MPVSCLCLRVTNGIRDGVFRRTLKAPAYKCLPEGF